MKAVGQILRVDMNMTQAAFRCAVQAYVAEVGLLLPSSRLHGDIALLGFTLS